MSEFSGATAPTRRGRRKGNYDPRPTSTVASCAPGPIALQQSVEELALAVQKARDGVLQELNRASSNAAEVSCAVPCTAHNHYVSRLVVMEDHFSPFSDSNSPAAPARSFKT